MSRLNLQENENGARWQKMIDHAQATVNLFNNYPHKIRQEFREPHHFVIFEALDRKGQVRTLAYNCFSEDESNKVAWKMSEHFNIEVEEE